MGEVERFDFPFVPSYRAAARIFGIRPSQHGSRLVTTDARFGPWRVSTPRTDVLDAVVTGPYAFFKTAGPARLAITDLGLTFASTDAQGVLITFAQPVRGLDPFGLLAIPS